MSLDFKGTEFRSLCDLGALVSSSQKRGPPLGETTGGAGDGSLSNYYLQILVWHPP